MADPRLNKLIETATRNEAAVQSLMRVAFDFRRRLKALELRLAFADRGEKPRLPIAFNSQYGEDSVLWSLFEDQPSGFFIEVGAYDGVDLSVSYVFEAVGWTGLLIEPIPARYEACVRNRPHSRVVHAALGPRGSTGTTTFTIIEGGPGDMFSYLSTNPRHAGVISQAAGKKVPVTVPLTSMDELLKDHAGPIDFAAIDVEGGELDLLDGFDLARFKPRVMAIEDNYQGTNAKFNDYMKALPYVFLARTGVTSFFIRADETELLRRGQQLKG